MSTFEKLNLTMIVVWFLSLAFFDSADRLLGKQRSSSLDLELVLIVSGLVWLLSSVYFIGAVIYWIWR